MRRFLQALLVSLVLTQSAMAAISIPRAVTGDPRITDPAHPARMEVIHVPVGGVEILGTVYVAAGAGPHPTMVIFHGLPGVEKNFDLAQAVPSRCRRWW